MTGLSTPRVLFLTWLAMALPGAAQTPQEPEEVIEQIRADLSEVTDSMALLRRESLTIEVARIERDSALIHIELALIAFRLGEVTGSNDHYDDAAGEFEWAAELRPDWVWGHYGRALAEYRLGEHRIISIENLRQLFGIDYISETVEALFLATEAEPGFVPALEMLAGIAPRQRFRRPIDDVFAAFDRALATDAAFDPELHLAYGRFLRDQGRYEEALTAFRRTLELGGRNPTRMLELGRTQFVLGMDRQGRSNYYEAARTMRSNDARELLRQDIVWIASSSELRAFDGLDYGDIEPWLHEFWERRALIAFRRPGERVAEHFRRYYYALQNYRLFSKNRVVETSLPYHSDQTEVDDRGVVHIRHGEPANLVTVQSATGGPDSYTWAYPGRDRRMILHFASGNATIARDYRLLESVGYDRYRAELIRNLDPIYERLSGGLGPSRAGFIATEVTMIRENIVLATNTDSYPIRFDTFFAAVRDIYVFAGGSADQGTSLIALALPSELMPRRITRDGVGVEYPVDIRVIGIGADNMVVDLVDTTRVFFSPAELPAGTALLAAVEVPLFRETPRLGIMIGDSARTVGSIMHTDTLVLPTLSSGTPAVSELLLGSDVLDVMWDSHDVRVNPLDFFRQDTGIDVYYEVYGLAEGQAYDVELRVKRKRSGVGGFLSGIFGGGAGIKIAFQGRADGLVTEVRQLLDIGDLDPGEYTVSLRVSIEGANTVERERDITVVE